MSLHNMLYLITGKEVHLIYNLQSLLCTNITHEANSNGGYDCGGLLSKPREKILK